MVKGPCLNRVGQILFITLVLAVSCAPSEEKKVKKQFELLSKWVSKDSRENAFTMAKKIQNITTLFTDDCTISVPEESLSGTYSRNEISRYAGQARLRFSKFSLRFTDYHIDFPEAAMATVNLTVRVTGQSTAGERVDEIRELRCVLRKSEDTWVFRSIEVVEVLKK
jgi:hypothetical protein